MNLSKMIEFFKCLAASPHLLRWVETTKEGQVTLWCRTANGLNVPHHEVHGIHDPMTGAVNYKATFYHPSKWGDNYFLDTNGIPHLLVKDRFVERAPINIPVGWKPKFTMKEEVIYED